MYWNCTDLIEHKDNNNDIILRIVICTWRKEEIKKYVIHLRDLKKDKSRVETCADTLQNSYLFFHLAPKRKSRPDNNIKQILQ